MDSQRNLLIIALLFVSFMIWRAREQDKNLQPQQQTTQTTTTAAGSAAGQDVPTSDQGKLITTKTDVLELTTNTNGGDIEQALFLAYPGTLKSTEPLQLLETTPQFAYQTQSGSTGRDGLDNPANGPCPLYSADKEAFVLADGQDEIVTPLTYTDKAGNVFTKTFTLERGGCAVNVGYNMQNAGEKPLEVSTFGQLKQTMAPLASRNTRTDGLSTIHTFHGTASPTLDTKYEKYKFDTILDNGNPNVSTKNGWVAMLQQYSTTVWVPQNNGANSFYTANFSNDIVATGYRSQPVLV